MAVTASTRRAALGAILAAPLSGTVIGWPVFRPTGPDLGFVAECWLRDAYALGMLLIRQPDGNIWRTIPVGGSRERADARDAHWVRLECRPRLMRAVYRAVDQGFAPWEEPACP